MTRHDERLLWDYAGHALEREEEKVLEHHLSECPDCTERLQAVRVAREALNDARLAEAPVAWQRVDDAIGAVVERRLSQKSRRPMWRMVWGGTAALAVAAAALLLFLRRPEPVVVPPLPAQALAVALPEARIDRAEGAVLLDSQAEPLKDGARLTGGDVLQTSPTARAFVHLPDASHLRVSGGTRLKLNRANADDVFLTLERGRIAVKASHVARKDFVVKSGGYSVFVVGTVFSVAQRGTDVEVAVSEGTVRLESDKGQLFVQAGQLVRLSAKGKARMGKLPAALQQELAEVAATNDTVSSVERRAAVAATGGQAGTRAAGLPRLTPAEARSRQVDLASEARTPDVPAQAAEPVPGESAPPAAVAEAQQPEPQASARPMDVIVEAPEPVWPTLGGEVLRGVPQVPMPPPSAPMVQPADDAEREWSAMPPPPAAPVAPSQPIAVVTPSPVAWPPADVQPPRAAAPAAGTPERLSEPPEAKGVEAIFLSRAEGSMGKGTCERFLPGLEEIASDQEKTPSSELARILRARCLDESLRPRPAAMEFRKYLLEYPQGRFVGEARAALGQ